MEEGDISLDVEGDKALLKKHGIVEDVNGDNDENEDEIELNNEQTDELKAAWEDDDDKRIQVQPS